MGGPHIRHVQMNDYIIQGVAKAGEHVTSEEQIIYTVS